MTNMARQFSLSIDDYYRRNPCLLVEVLSDSTARIDRREKFSDSGSTWSSR